MPDMLDLTGQQKAYGCDTIVSQQQVQEQLRINQDRGPLWTLEHLTLCRVAASARVDVVCQNASVQQGFETLVRTLEH